MVAVCTKTPLAASERRTVRACACTQSEPLQTCRDRREDVAEAEGDELHQPVEQQWQQGPDGRVPGGSPPLLHAERPYCDHNGLRRVHQCMRSDDLRWVPQMPSSLLLVVSLPQEVPGKCEEKFRFLVQLCCDPTALQMHCIVNRGELAWACS